MHVAMTLINYACRYFYLSGFQVKIHSFIQCCLIERASAVTIDVTTIVTTVLKLSFITNHHHNILQLTTLHTEVQDF